MRIRLWGPVALLLAAPAVAAPAKDDPAAWMGVPGAVAELVAEPVLGGRVMVYRAGRREGDAVVLVHGLGSSAVNDWPRLVRALAPHYDVFALDLPGFGKSDKGNKLYSPGNYVRVLEAAIAPRVGRPFHLVGHSMGAAIALAYAAAHPQRVKQLVLADMAGVLSGPVYAESLAKYGIGQKTGIPEDASWLDSMLGRVISGVEALPFSEEIVLRTPALRQQLLRGDPIMIAAFALGQHNFSRALRTAPMPTLLLWGSEDKVAPLRTAQVASALMPQSRLELIAGAGHVPMSENPARFNAAVLEHLAGRELPARTPARSGPIEGQPQSCNGQAGARYTGDIPKLTLARCKGARISGARIGSLQVVDSDVEVVDTEIAGGLHAQHSKVQLTGGSVAGAPPLSLEASEVDAAGTRFDAGAGELAVNLGALELELWLSVVELRRGGSSQYLHGTERIAPAAR